MALALLEVAGMQGPYGSEAITASVGNVGQTDPRAVAEGRADQDAHQPGMGRRDHFQDPCGKIWTVSHPSTATTER